MVISLLAARKPARRLTLGVGVAAALLFAKVVIACTGDCNGDGAVTVDELIKAVNIALGTANLSSCMSADRDASGDVTVDEIIAAVDVALMGCALSTPSPTMTATATPTGSPGPESVLVRMDAAMADGFFSLPWPNDVRVAADGTLNMSGFPGSQSNPIIQAVLTRGAKATRGFGTNAAVFFQTTGALDAASLPGAEASLSASSPAMLVNLDDPDAPRVPLLVDFNAVAGKLRPANMLTLLPYPGHPLHPRTHYAAILFTAIRDAHGGMLSPSALLGEAAATGVPAGATADRLAALLAQRDEVFAYVSAHTTWLTSQVAAFTVYTTQDSVGDMLAIRAAVDALPSPTPASRAQGHCGAGVDRATVEGYLDLPKWQQGPYPYISGGGAIVVQDGKAVQQSVEHALFEITYPCGAPPLHGWPILLFMDGTGAGPNSSGIAYIGAGPSDPALPYVVASIAPLYSADRFVPGFSFPYDSPEGLFFNYLNPVAGRTNQLQQAADMLYLRRIVQGLTLSAAETGQAEPVDTDDSIVVIAGHSQGSVTLPQAIAVDPSFTAGFISSGGGALYLTILHRGDVRPMIEQILGTASGELDMFHPALHAVQTLAETGDAANYGPLVHTAHVLATGGRIDGCSPLEVVSVIGAAMGLQTVNPIDYPMFGVASLEPPLTLLPAHANLPDGRTGVTVRLDTGHFGSITNPFLGRSFVESAAAGGVPEVAAGDLQSDQWPGCVRFDPLP